MQAQDSTRERPVQQDPVKLPGSLKPLLEQAGRAYSDWLASEEDAFGEREAIGAQEEFLAALRPFVLGAKEAGMPSDATLSILQRRFPEVPLDGLIDLDAAAEAALDQAELDEASDDPPPAPSLDRATPSPTEAPWYYQWWFIIVALIFVGWPGLFPLWKSPLPKRNTKFALTAVFIILPLLLLAGIVAAAGGIAALSGGGNSGQLTGGTMATHESPPRDSTDTNTGVLPPGGSTTANNTGVLPPPGKVITDSDPVSGSATWKAKRSDGYSCILKWTVYQPVPRNTATVVHPADSGLTLEPGADFDPSKDLAMPVRVWVHNTTPNLSLDMGVGIRLNDPSGTPSTSGALGAGETQDGYDVQFVNSDQSAHWTVTVDKAGVSVKMFDAGSPHNLQWTQIAPNTSADANGFFVIRNYFSPAHPDGDESILSEVGLLSGIGNGVDGWDVQDNARALTFSGTVIDNAH